MPLCTFCKANIASAAGPCPKCGRQQSAAPPAAPSLDGWDDDDGSDPLGGGLDLSRGSSMMDHQQSSAYSGGGLSLGDDDDPFADAVPAASLELDIPTHHTANTSRSMPVQQGSLQPPQGSLQPPHGSQQPPPSQPHLAMGSVPQIQMPSGQPQAMQPPQSQPSLPSPPQSQPSLPAAGPSGPIPGAPPSQPGSNPLLGGPMHAPQTPNAAAMIARYPAPPSKLWESPIYAMKVLWRQMELRQDIASLKKKRSPDVALYERALKTHDAKTFAVGLAITCATLAIASFVFFLPVILRFMRDPD